MPNIKIIFICVTPRRTAPFFLSAICSDFVLILKEEKQYTNYVPKLQLYKEKGIGNTVLMCCFVEHKKSRGTSVNTLFVLYYQSLNVCNTWQPVIIQ